MSPRLVLLALSISAAALAQTTGTIQIQLNSQAQVAVGPSDCGSSVVVTWTLSGVTQVCATMPLWVTPTSSCGDAPGTGDFQFAEVTISELQTGQGNETLALADLPGLSDGAGGTGCGVAASQDFKVCGASSTAGGFPASCAVPTTIKTGSPPTLTYDGLPPPAPTLTGVIPLDSALKVTVSPGSGTANIDVQVKLETAPDSDFHRGVLFSVDQGNSGRVDGLTNGVTYAVRALGIDAAGNVSGPSEVLTGTPVPTEGFWGAYRRLNGADQGGCSVAGGLAGPAVAAALGVFLTRRRRRR